MMEELTTDTVMPARLCTRTLAHTLTLPLPLTLPLTLTLTLAR